MKFLVAGDWRWYQYEGAFSQALYELGHEVFRFSFSEYFGGPISRRFRSLPVPTLNMWWLNRNLIRATRDLEPDIVLIWRGTHVFPVTLHILVRLGVITVSYNNDDPFGPRVRRNVPWHHHFLWFWYLRSLKHFDFNFFYRQVNVSEALTQGALHADVLRSYFIPRIHQPLTLTDKELKRFKCQAVFVGHYEPDVRVEYLKALVDAGISVKLFGDRYWTAGVLGKLYDYFSPIVPVFGTDYSKALNGAHVCLVFLSKANRDTYTRRCFEIPACGRTMLAERTADLQKMFVEDKEACFFSSTEELVSKAKWLIDHPNLTQQIAAAGMTRVWKDGHDVKSRVREFLDKLKLSRRRPAHS